MGLVLNKARKLIDKQTDGDITAEKFRDLIIKDLNDIKIKIDRNSDKNLLAVYHFLEKGVLLLNLSLVEDGLNTRTTATGKATTTGKGTTTQSESEIQIETTPVQTVCTSNARFVSSQDSFKAALEEATRAFFNESLNLQGRIMAAIS